jgi:hypothetical protein
MTESTKAQRCGSRKGKQNASLVAPEFPYWLHATSPNGVIEGLPTLIGTRNGVSPPRSERHMFERVDSPLNQAPCPKQRGDKL